MEKLTIRVTKQQLKKLDSLHRRFWPTLSPRRGRGAVIRVLINQVPTLLHIARKPERK
jgi:hypothetical protein